MLTIINISVVNSESLSCDNIASLYRIYQFDYITPFPALLTLYMCTDRSHFLRPSFESLSMISYACLLHAQAHLQEQCTIWITLKIRTGISWALNWLKEKKKRERCISEHVTEKWLTMRLWFCGSRHSLRQPPSHSLLLSVREDELCEHVFSELNVWKALPREGKVYLMAEKHSSYFWCAYLYRAFASVWVREREIRSEKDVAI